MVFQQTLFNKGRSLDFGSMLVYGNTNQGGECIGILLLYFVGTETMEDMTASREKKFMLKKNRKSEIINRKSAILYNGLWGHKVWEIRGENQYHHFNTCILWASSLIKTKRKMVNAQSDEPP